MKIAVVGATGMVGRVMLEVLEQKGINYSELYMVASEKSVGQKMVHASKEYTVIGLNDALRNRPDVALFSAGGETSKVWAPKFADLGTVVIDNSSAWRMASDKKLIVPEINSSQLTSTDKIIANPNCSTIQMVLALAPLHKLYKIKRVVVSTYQSITGTGVKAVKQLEDEIAGLESEKAYPYTIFQNVIPQCDQFESNGYTKEELKLINETKKILDDQAIQVTATAVRIPVVGGHSESVNLTFEKPFELEQVRAILNKTDGVTVLDDPAKMKYPMPLNAQGKDDVFVGRIRRDHSCQNSLNLWIVSDNLRKGAATNAVQILEYLIKNQLVGGVNEVLN